MEEPRRKRQRWRLQAFSSENFQDRGGQLELKAWPQDVLRHTAASHWLALRRDAAAVALELGTSVEILMRHYRELVPDAQAAAFWAVLPRLRLP